MDKTNELDRIKETDRTEKRTEKETLRLEKFQGESDFALFARLAYDENVMQMNYGRAFTEQEARLFYQGIQAANEGDGVLGYYKVFLVPENSPKGPFIGMCGMNFNSDFDGVELEYMLLPSFWHQGWGKALAGVMIHSIESQGKYGRLLGITDPANIYSRKILLGHGFRLRTAYTIDDGSTAEVFERLL